MKNGILRIAFDIGGVISKYPDEFFVLIETLNQGVKRVHENGGKAMVECHIISDMHPKEKVVEMLRMNGFAFHSDNVHSADYKTHGEECKAILCRELDIHILIDDFIGYVNTAGAPPIRLLVMPDSSKPYYATAEDPDNPESLPHWYTDGSEGEFGRRNPAGSKRPPEGGKKAIP